MQELITQLVVQLLAVSSPSPTMGTPMKPVPTSTKTKPPGVPLKWTKMESTWEMRFRALTKSLTTVHSSNMVTKSLITLTELCFSYLFFAGYCDMVHEGLCVFPFHYSSNSNNTQCLQSSNGYKWCPTSVDAENNYHGQWISCRGPHCLPSEEPEEPPPQGNMYTVFYSEL